MDSLHLLLVSSCFLVRRLLKLSPNDTSNQCASIYSCCFLYLLAYFIFIVAKVLTSFHYIEVFYQFLTAATLWPKAMCFCCQFTPICSKCVRHW